MQVNISNVAGQSVSQLEVSDYLFKIPVNTAAMHQAMVAQLNNARQGNASTKTRGEVAGSTRKLYPQKHTGRARRGDIRSPILKGGGIVFGPHPRDYRTGLNKKVRILALRSALSDKAKSGKLVVVEQMELESHKTKQMMAAVKNLGITGKALFVTVATTDSLVLAARNIPGIKVIALDSLNLIDLLNHEYLVMTVDAVKKAEQIWAKAEPPAEGKGAQKE